MIEERFVELTDQEKELEAAAEGSPPWSEQRRELFASLFERCNQVNQFWPKEILRHTAALWSWARGEIILKEILEESAVEIWNLDNDLHWTAFGTAWQQAIRALDEAICWARNRACPTPRLVAELTENLLAVMA